MTSLLTPTETHTPQPSAFRQHKGGEWVIYITQMNDRIWQRSQVVLMLLQRLALWPDAAELPWQMDGAGMPASITGEQPLICTIHFRFDITGQRGDGVIKLFTFTEKWWWRQLNLTSCKEAQTHTQSHTDLFSSVARDQGMASIL